MTTGKILDFIPDMAQELPALAAGEETTVDRLMLAASICGWIMDYPDCEIDEWARVLGDRKTHAAIITAGIDDGTCFILMTEWANGEIEKVIDYADCTAEELADIGRVFLNAAIAKHQQEISNA